MKLHIVTHTRIKIFRNKTVKLINFILLFHCIIHTNFLFAQGNTCSNPILVPNLPYVVSNTTCGSIDDYGSQCNGDYGGGEDVQI